MFTGLVEAVGELVERTPTSGGFRLRIGSPLAAELSLGDSLAVNGVCLTVVALEGAEIHADVGPETVRVTTLGSLPGGSVLNLERPLRADSRRIGRVEELRPDSEFHWLTVSFPSHLAPFFVNKGSVAVDGISLTVARLRSDRFDIQVVPFTMEHTNVSHARIGDTVNLECDMVGKYVARAVELAGLTAR